MDYQINADKIERWGVFEAAVSGRTDGNPFTDYTIVGTFAGKNETVVADGFYDGDGIYRVRFMPSFEGDYTFKISGSAIADEPSNEPSGFTSGALFGKFTVTAPSAGNHGSVRVADTWHFAYEDGTPFYPVGTTCYVWTHQPREMQEETLQTLKNGYFNKIRFCILPKHFDFNFHDPVTFPYEGTPCDNSGITKENFMEYKPDYPGNKWDFRRFNPQHFRLLENRIKDLRDMGVEADLIVMHPYDRWGFSDMGAECDDLYWKYVIARFSAFRNVWWSFANEYDLMRAKTLADWERYASIVCEKDPYSRLRSVHNCFHLYDFRRPWVTHCCIQLQSQALPLEKTDEWRRAYQKPVVVDEMIYEGNIEHGWGNISGKEMVRRFWEITALGGYAGHGETYAHPDDKLWWSHGGKLHGESPERIKFLRKILEESPYGGLNPSRREYRTAVSSAAFDEGAYRLIYFGIAQPSFQWYHFDDVNDYDVEIIDTWEMTIKRAGAFRGRFKIDLPGKEYMAVRIIRKDYKKH